MPEAVDVSAIATVLADVHLCASLAIRPCHGLVPARKRKAISKTQDYPARNRIGARLWITTCHAARHRIFCAGRSGMDVCKPIGIMATTLSVG